MKVPSWNGAFVQGLVALPYSGAGKEGEKKPDEIGLERIPETAFRRDPRRQLVFSGGAAKTCSSTKSLCWSLEEFLQKVPQRLLRATTDLAASVADSAAALKLASAASVACLTAFWTDSNALEATDTAFFMAATALSEPAGAFLVALSTKRAKFF